MVYTDAVLVPGDVTVIVMFPTAPALADAVKVTESSSPPSAVRHPIVQLAPWPLIVPIAASATTDTVVPAAIGLPLKSCTVKLIPPVLTGAGAAGEWVSVRAVGGGPP